MSRGKLLLKDLELVFLNAKGDVNLSHVKEVSSTFDERHCFVLNLGSLRLVFAVVLICVAVVLVVVTTQYEVDSWHLTSQLLVVSYSHVRQCDHILAFLLLTKHLRLLTC